MPLKLVSAPATEPLTYEQAKAHLREDSDDFQVTIEAFLSAAIGYVDGPRGYLGRALVDQTWDLYLDEFPCYRYGFPHPLHGWRNHHAIQIPLPPLIEVFGVFYTGSDGSEQEFDAANYIVDNASQPARVCLKNGVSWPMSCPGVNSVRIRFRAGYLDQSVSPAVENVPKQIKAAILLYLGDLYANRENTVVGDTAIELPYAAKALLRPYRVYLNLA